MNRSRLFVLSLLTLVCGTALAGNLTVNLSPSAAVTAGAQWRVDGGNWRNSGVTVKNLSNAAHTLEYKALTGWIAPTSTSVNLTNNVTTTVTGTYVQPAAVAVTLTPSTGQWRIDGGAWRSSGTTATGLTPGAHTISYNALSNYNSPASETVTLVGNQTTNLSRSYTAVAALTVTLTPSNASWQVDGGSWRPSGATVTGLIPGAHTIGFSTVAGMLPLAPESISLPAAQATSINRSYTAEAGLVANLTPATAQWRVDTGAWQNSGTRVGQLSAGDHIVYYNAASGYTAPASEHVALVAGQTTTVARSYTAVSAITVNLTPSSGTWQIDGGAWQASGATVAGLTPGNHTIAYSTVTGMLPMPSETVNLPGTETASLARSYTAEAGLTVTLTLSTAQWRLDGGAWRNSGDLVGQLIAGSHTVDYTAADGYLAPASETVALVAGQTITVARSYTAVSAVTVNLSPSNATWQVDGGAWQASGATVAGLTPGNHTFAYSAITGMLPMTNETVNLPGAETTSFTRSYVAEAGLTVTLAPSTAQWRVDGGSWQGSGIRIGQLTAGNHIVDYNVTEGYRAPASESITLVAGETNTVTRSYIAVSGVSVNLTPSSGTWQVDGGAWQTSGAIVAGLTPGNHTIAYSTVTGMLSMASETVSLPSAETTSLMRSYTAEASLVVTLTPSTAQWRVDAGVWRNSGDRVGQLTAGNHAIDYNSITGYTTPASETVALTSGETTALTRTYTALASLTVNLSEPTAMWQLDGGGWRNSGATAVNLAPGSHTIAYTNNAAALPPPSESITLQPGDVIAISRNYTPAGQVLVTLSPNTAQWRVDGGAWRATNTYSGLLAAGTHTLEYSPAATRLTPPAETVTIAAGQNLELLRIYTFESVLTVNLTPAIGQWRVDGGAWHNSGERVDQLTPGSHTVDYTTLDGYGVLPAESVVINEGATRTLSRTYPPPPAHLTVNLSDPNGSWQADTSGWHNSGETINLPPGSHAIYYLNSATALAPATEVLTLQPDEARTISREYTLAGQVYVTLSPSTALWRVDAGTWHASATYSGLLAPGTHTLAYSAVPTKVTPPTETVNIVAGQNLTVSRTYAAELFLTITLTPSVGQWRVDGGGWHNSGERVGQLAAGSHSVEYSSVSGYVAPPAEAVVLAAGDTTLARTYLRPASLTVTINGAEGQWRLNNGPWQGGGATLSGLRPGTYTIQFSSVAGYFDISDEVITLAENQNKSVTYTYNPQASVTVTLTPGNAMWRLNGGAWQASGATIGALWASQYDIEYSPVDGMTAPPREGFFLNLGEQKTLSRTYEAPPSLTVTLTPAVGQWRMDGGAWQMTGNVISNLTPGGHLIEYTDAPGYITPPAETFTANNHGPTNLTRVYRDASTGHLNVNIVPARFGELGLAKWRVDGGVWNASGETVAVSPGSHTLEFQPVVGLDVPAPTTVTATAGTVETLEATYYMPHRLRFFLHGDLVSGLSTAELQARLSQYAAHLQTIWGRESFRRFVFNPATDISIVWTQPFTAGATPPLPEYGFEVWAYAVAGTSYDGGIGGFPAIDSSGAAGVGDMHWTQIYDPSTLAPGSPELSDYWKQIDTMTRELEHVFGAGLGSYGSARQLPDLTGVTPFYSVDYSTTADPFWNAHSDFWRDPLLQSAWGNYRIDSPTALPGLLDSVRFSATSRAIIDGCYRNAAWTNPLTTVPDSSHVRVIVVDANTRQPISGAMVRMWHRPGWNGSPEEWVQPIFERTGTFEFSWTGNTLWNPFNESDNAKLLKAYAPGYQPKAQWEWLYDGQRVKIIDKLDVWEITVALDPAS